MTSGVRPVVKAAPSAVAQSVVDALSSGVEDVFPDPTSVAFHDSWKKDAKALELESATYGL
jgi:hypothetical protein